MGLMQQFKTQAPQNSLSAILAMTKGNPQALMSQLVQSDRNFALFVEQNKGKTPEQAFSEHGFDFSQFKNLIR